VSIIATTQDSEANLLSLGVQDQPGQQNEAPSQKKKKKEKEKREGRRKKDRRVRRKKTSLGVS
jgi:hypothetical protein